MTIPKIKFSFDYVFPWLLPFFAGLYMEAPQPNLTSFGTRIGYHFDMGIDNLDIYLMYCFDFGFLPHRTRLPPALGGLLNTPVSDMK
jgi:hypothetical protein